MNLYLRYFDKETLVESVDEAVSFLSSIEEIQLDDKMEQDLRQYVASEVLYPKRYKVRARVYFIVIKTEAKTMLDFKQKKALRSPDKMGASPTNVHMEALLRECYGWYEGKLCFKRVVTSPITGKCDYKDTVFLAQCKANSGKDCYDRIVEHLVKRVDSRSQFPSVKGDNFEFKFLGLCK